MTRPTIAARVATPIMAVAEEAARGLLAMDWPETVQASATRIVAEAGLRIEPGERYGVHRGVAVMPIRGILTADSVILERYMGWSTYAGIEAAAAELMANEEVAAVVLDVNSPGGHVLGVEGAAAALARLAEVKPVYAIVAPLAASAAYWLTVQARSIAVQPGSWVGSIGVLATTSWSLQPGEAGYQDFEIASAHARAKNPDPTTEGGRALIQMRIDATEGRFHAAVAAGRGIAVADLPGVLSMTGDPADGGGVFWPDDAVSRGLADTIEDRAAFYARIFAAHSLVPSNAAARPRTRAALAARAAAALAASPI